MIATPLAASVYLMAGAPIIMGLAPEFTRRSRLDGFDAVAAFVVVSGVMLLWPILLLLAVDQGDPS